MNKRKKLGLLLVFAGLFLCPFVSLAEPTASRTIPIQVSFFHPLQAYPDAYSVDGFRLNFIYGVNDNVSGLDIGLFNEANGNVQGFELGLDNRVGGDFTGGQISLFNEVKGNADFLQLGALANITRGSFQGLQISVFYNDTAVEMRGLQLGLVNHAGSLYGVQLGLLNFNDDTKYLGFFPFINAAF
jgi:hypothetical protein